MQLNDRGSGSTTDSRGASAEASVKEKPGTGTGSGCVVCHELGVCLSSFQDLGLLVCGMKNCCPRFYSYQIFSILQSWEIQHSGKPKLPLIPCTVALPPVARNHPRKDKLLETTVCLYGQQRTGNTSSGSRQVRALGRVGRAARAPCKQLAAQPSCSQIREAWAPHPRAIMCKIRQI